MKPLLTRSLAAVLAVTLSPGTAALAQTPVDASAADTASEDAAIAQIRASEAAGIRQDLAAT